ncbi:hypothetical protein C8R43DRAFT_1231172, partial [Mycena crocata]
MYCFALAVPALLIALIAPFSSLFEEDYGLKPHEITPRQLGGEFLRIPVVHFDYVDTTLLVLDSFPSHATTGTVTDNSVASVFWPEASGLWLDIPSFASTRISAGPLVLRTFHALLDSAAVALYLLVTGACIRWFIERLPSWSLEPEVLCWIDDAIPTPDNVLRALLVLVGIVQSVFVRAVAANSRSDDSCEKAHGVVRLERDASDAVFLAVELPRRVDNVHRLPAVPVAPANSIDIVDVVEPAAHIAASFDTVAVLLRATFLAYFPVAESNEEPTVSVEDVMLSNSDVTSLAALDLGGPSQLTQKDIELDAPEEPIRRSSRERTSTAPATFPRPRRVRRLQHRHLSQRWPNLELSASPPSILPGPSSSPRSRSISRPSLAQGHRRRRDTSLGHPRAHVLHLSSLPHPFPPPSSPQALCVRESIRNIRDPADRGHL